MEDSQPFADGIIYSAENRNESYPACRSGCVSSASWELSRNIDHQLAMNALDRAIENRWSESTHGLVHHSDQGVQYASYYNIDAIACSNFKSKISYTLICFGGK